MVTQSRNQLARAPSMISKRQQSYNHKKPRLERGLLGAIRSDQINRITRPDPVLLPGYPKQFSYIVVQIPII